jgi:hypothetical protein
MRRLLLLGLAALAGLSPGPAMAAGSPSNAAYGDPAGWCTRFSDMWTATVITSDPNVASNPEANTFYGFHPNPGYDDWYGYFYGDFRGSPGDASGWVKLLHERYPDHYHWNFATNGWSVHGHVKQYIAYYNWTFGGQCGLGRYGSMSPPPFMADQYGWPVVDFYVDSVPPYLPAPRVIAAGPTSATFTWDPVADQGDGGGRDYFAAGMDHYTSWVTVDGGPPLQLESTAAPRTITQAVPPRALACVHVLAFDKLQNGTPDQVACGRALGTPPVPPWPALESAVRVNPSPLGLAGFESWFWLAPVPAVESVIENVDGVRYLITATPSGVDWDFGEGAIASLRGADSYGSAFPDVSAVSHVYEAHRQSGYVVQAAVRYSLTWSALVGGSWSGPYPLATIMRPASPLTYPVEQAQPELLLTSP